jgi:cobalt-zinc-cadmium efflux system outer membrane protein
LLLCALPGWTQERSLTLEEALALARERGAEVVLAQGRIEEARARQAQAGRRFQEDPVLDVGTGLREAGDLDFEASVSQDLYAGRQRAARLASTQAGLDRAEAELAEARRLLLRDVWTTFVHVLAARDRAELLARSRQAADALLATAERRYEAGEATALEINRARTAAAGARAEQAAAQADASADLAGLQALLGLPEGETVQVQGTLAPRPPVELEALLAKIGDRPDLKALEAELSEAEAEVLLGQALARPDWGVRAGVGRDEGDGLVTAGVVVSLPVHGRGGRGGRGRETVAVGQARAAALRLALATARAAADAEVRGRHSALTHRLAAVQELESLALPALDDNESLALKSFEAGEIDLGELLLVRREILETRLAYLERLLDAALTRLELESAAGALP